MTRRAAETAGWDLADYGEPHLRRAGNRWEVILPAGCLNAVPAASQVNVWLDDNTGEASVVPTRSPTATPVTEEEFMRQADRVAAEAGWRLADYVKGDFFDHGDCWSVLYKGRSGLPGDYFSVKLVLALGAARVVPGR